jgi:hypothetical protein
MLSKRSQDNQELMTNVQFPLFLGDTIQMLQANRPLLVDRALQIYQFELSPVRETEQQRMSRLNNWGWLATINQLD